jgi:hypothetical protein
MSYRSLALAVAAFSSIQVASADAQSVYVAPGGVYIGGGPVYVIPAPNNGAAPYVAPTYGYCGGAGTRGRGSYDGLWTQRRLLRRPAFGLCGRATAAAARGHTPFQQPWLCHSLWLRALLLS